MTTVGDFPDRVLVYDETTEVIRLVDVTLITSDEDSTAHVAPSARSISCSRPSRSASSLERGRNSPIVPHEGHFRSRATFEIRVPQHSQPQSPLAELFLMLTSGFGFSFAGWSKYPSANSQVKGSAR